LTDIDIIDILVLFSFLDGGFMRIKIHLLSLMVGLGVTWASQSFAQRQPLANSPGQNWIQELKLSPEQMQQIQGIRKGKQVEIQQKTQQLDQARKRLRELLVSDASQEVVRREHQKVQALSQEVQALRFEVLLTVREVMTLEQRQQLSDQFDKQIQTLKERLPRRPGQNFPGRPQRDKGFPLQ
jgi:Spy/CpxP family protein refolding chaperone